MKIQDDFVNKGLIDNCIIEKEKRRLEIKSLILIAIGSISFGIVNFHTKLTKHIFVESFDPVCFMIYRSLCICLLGYFFCKRNETRIIRFNEIKAKFWFIIRTIGNYVSFFTFIMMMIYFRASTAACINSMFPAVSIFFSILILKEDFYIRYIIGLIICCSGTLMIIFNERIDPAKMSSSLQHNAETGSFNTMRIIYGSIFGLANVFTVALLTISVKIVMNEKINLHVQCFWVGLTNTFCGIFHLLFMGSISLYPPYFLFSFINGGLWYISSSLLQEGFKHTTISHSSPLAYFSTVTVFTLGVLVLGEPIFFTDIIGSIMILSFNLYNVYLPPKR